MTDNEMHRATAGLPTKSAKMRALRAAGVPRSQIAKFLGVRYQHVRNVEKDDERRRYPAPDTEDAHGVGFAEEAPRAIPSDPTRIVHFPTAADGSLVIPREVLAAYGFRAPDRVTLIPEGPGRVRMLSSDESIKYAQELISRHSRPGVSLVDELFKMRREEVEKEEREYREMQERSRRK